MFSRKAKKQSPKPEKKEEEVKSEKQEKKETKSEKLEKKDEDVKSVKSEKKEEAKSEKPEKKDEDVKSEKAEEEKKDEPKDEQKEENNENKEENQQDEAKSQAETVRSDAPPPDLPPFEYDASNTIKVFQETLKQGRSNPCIYIFNVGKANFVLVRQNDKGVIVDCGDDNSGLVRAFRDIAYADKDFRQCEELLKQYQTLKRQTRKLYTDSAKHFPDNQKIVENAPEWKKQIQDPTAQLEQLRNELKYDARNKRLHIFFYAFKGLVEIQKIFITKQDNEHTSMLELLKDAFPELFASTQVILAGKPMSEEFDKKLKDTFGKHNVEYIKGKYYPTRTGVILNGVKYIIWGRHKDEDDENEEEEEEEKKSTSDEEEQDHEEEEEELLEASESNLVISLLYHSSIVLFTGDETGDQFGTLNVDLPPQDNITSKGFKQFVNKAKKEIIEARKLIVDKDTEKVNIIQKIMDDFSEFSKQCQLSKVNYNAYKQYLEEILTIERSNIIFDPDHGSNRNKSHEITQYLFAQRTKQIHIISSDPKSEDWRFPRREQILTPYPEYNFTVNRHFVEYYSDIDQKTHVERIPTPIYLTSQAKDNVIAIVLHKTSPFATMHRPLPEQYTL